MQRYRRRVTAVLLTIAGLVVLVEACAPALTFRAYLSPDFFQPVRRGLATLARGLPAEKNNYLPYAGIAESSDGTPIAGLREAYRNLLYSSAPRVGRFGEQLPLVFPIEAIETVRERIRNFNPVDAGQGHEVDLLRCKLDLRAARIDDDASLAAAQACLQNYLQQSRPDALRSEARGWLARTHYLRKNHAEAAKIYVDELESPVSNLKRERLLKSLNMLYRWSPMLRNEDLTTFFDSPSHALYIANIVTNSSSRNGTDDVTKALLAGLEQNKSLFREGPQSEALAMTQMRAALRLGDPDAILRFAGMIPASSTLRADAEYLWLTGSAHVLKRNDRAAEPVFLELLNSRSAAASDNAKAGAALEGVYERLGRPVDQLWAALRVAALDPELWQEFHERGEDPSPLDGVGTNLDVAFLLDVQLTDLQLQQYLDRYGQSPIVGTSSAGDMVRYAQAVRHARKEEFEEAARVYAALNVVDRALQAGEAARLFAATRRAGAEEAQMQALYDYADFLASNPDGIFFNNGLWHGFQASAFTSRENHPFPMPAADRLPRVRQLERKLQDEQEEYWRAYQILNGIVMKAGPTPLGKQAARRAIVCLRRINARFGRLQEIQAADRRLSSWLLRNESPRRGE